MYTNCPECGTVFRISTSDLRVAEGYVRCGHCSATFNALATLADELPPTVTLNQLTLPTERDAGPAVKLGTAAPEPETEAEPDTRPAVPALAEGPSPAPEPQVARGDVPQPINDDTLEFDIPEDSWSNFFAANGPEQTGLYRALPEETSAPHLDEDGGGDWQVLLEEVQDAEPASEPVYVISEEPREEPPLREPREDDPGLAGSPLPAPLPADLAAGLREPIDSGPRPGPEGGESAADRPFLWKPPVPPAAVRSSRHRAYTAGSVLLTLLVLMQVLHLQRDQLATNPLLTGPLQRMYGALGLPLWPAWDLRAYELRTSEAVADRSSRGALDILGRIVVVGNKPVGLPLVRVTLRDRLARPLGSRVFRPEEYLAGNSQPRGLVNPGTLIPVDISLRDPGPDAQGFDVDICVTSQREGIVCRADHEPFMR